MNARLLALLIVVALASGATGWFLHTPPANPDKTAEAATPKLASAPPAVIPKVDAPKAAPAQVATPQASPAPASAASAPATPPSTTAASGAGSPQAAPPELVTSIAEITSVVRAGDFTSLIENYMAPDQLARMTPEQKTFYENQMTQTMQSPQGQQALQAMTQMYDSLAGLTPNISSDGTRATYQVPTPKGLAPEGTALPPTLPVSFVKENGRWYVASGM